MAWIIFGGDLAGANDSHESLTDFLYDPFVVAIIGAFVATTLAVVMLLPLQIVFRVVARATAEKNNISGVVDG